jgi:hypothetical protein
MGAARLVKTGAARLVKMGAARLAGSARPPVSLFE